MEAITAVAHAIVQVAVGSFVGHQLDEACNNYLLPQLKETTTQYIAPHLDDPRDIHAQRIKSASAQELATATGIQMTAGVCFTLLLGNGVPFVFSGDPMFGIPYYLTFFAGQEKMLANFKELNTRINLNK